MAKYNSVYESERQIKMFEQYLAASLLFCFVTVVAFPGSSIKSVSHRTNNGRENEQHIYLFDERKSYIIPTHFAFHLSLSPVWQSGKKKKRFLTLSGGELNFEVEEDKTGLIGTDR